MNSSVSDISDKPQTLSSPEDLLSTLQILQQTVESEG
jgi:hypothetical protein